MYFKFQFFKINDIILSRRVNNKFEFFMSYSWISFVDQCGLVSFIYYSKFAQIGNDPNLQQTKIELILNPSSFIYSLSVTSLELE